MLTQLFNSRDFESPHARLKQLTYRVGSLYHHVYYDKIWNVWAPLVRVMIDLEKKHNAE